LGRSRGVGERDLQVCVSSKYGTRSTGEKAYLFLLVARTSGEGLLESLEIGDRDCVLEDGDRDILLKVYQRCAPKTSGMYASLDLVQLWMSSRQRMRLNCAETRKA